MSKKINTISAKISEKSLLLLEIDESIVLEEIVPTGQMLVDSDNLSFIYILELKESYIYLVLHNEIWPVIKVGLVESANPLLVNQTGVIGLPMFYDELSYLIDNIRGNSNYGEEMVVKVESIF